MQTTSEQIKFYLSFVGFIIMSLYLVYLKSCEPEPAVFVQTIGTDSLRVANDDLKDIIEGLNVVINEQEQEIAKKKTVYLQGKERVKYLSQTVTITDTLVIEYTEAMKAQLDKADTIIEIQAQQIDTMQFKITKQDTLIKNTEMITDLMNAELEKKNGEIKKLNRKIKGLKIVAILSPIATILVILAANGL